MNINEKIHYWIEIALDDLDSAKILLKKKKYLQSGFYCQQAVEKIMKGYFCYFKNDEPPYTHNLLKLAEVSGLNDVFNDDQKAHIDLLMPLNIEARYPDDKREINKMLNVKKSKEIFKRTEEMIKWILQLMKK